MIFDEWWDDDAGETTVADDLPKAPNGRHAGEIVYARFEDVKFKVSDKNPRGTSLVVKVDLRKYEQVKDIVPVQFRGAIQAICRSARLPVPAKGEDWKADGLIGCQVQVETVLCVAKGTGNEYVRIDKWHPAPELPATTAAKPAPARTPAAKVEAALQGGAADDIPF